MAKASPAVPAATFVQPTAGAPAPAPVSPAPEGGDPFAGTTFYAADAWTPPKPPVSPTVTAFMGGLLSQGSIVVVTEGWDPAKINTFIKQIKDAKHLVENRRIGVKSGGTAEGQTAIKVTLGKASELPASA
jgi:hypothetical protein